MYRRKIYKGLHKKSFLSYGFITGYYKLYNHNSFARKKNFREPPASGVVSALAPPSFWTQYRN